MNRRFSASSLAALAVAAFLASLSLVAWRQSRAMEVLTELDRIRGDQALALAERADLVQRIQALTSRSRVTRDASEQLGMFPPPDSSIVLLELDTR